MRNLKTNNLDLVWNVEGTSILTSYKSFKKQTKSRCTTCSIRDCKYELSLRDDKQPHIVGAHMTDGKDVYLIPICAGCNHHTNKEKMQLKPGRNIKRIGTLYDIEDKILNRQLERMGI